MDRSTDRQRIDRSGKTHMVGVHSTDDAREPELARASHTDEVGVDAVHRAVALGACGALVGAILFGLALALFTSSSATVVVAGVIGGAVLFGAIGALWGSFSRLGRGDDWREAMPDRPSTPEIDLRDAHPEQPGDAPLPEDARSAARMVKRGALAVTDDPDSVPAEEDHGTASASGFPGANRFAAPASVGHVLRSDDFLGKVPVTLVFIPDGPATDAMLRGLDEVFPRFGEARVQLLVVLGVDAAEVSRRHDALGLHVPLLADPEGRLALDHGVAGSGDQVRAFVMDRDGRLVDQVAADATALEPAQLLTLTTEAAARQPERFEPHPAHRS